MKFNFIAIVFFLCLHNIFSQTSRLDSLQIELKKAGHDSLKVQVLKDISWEYLNNRSNIQMAEKYIDSVYYLSKEIRLEWGIAVAKYQYGVLERQKGNYTEALAYFDEYIEFSNKTDDQIDLANGLYQKAVIFDNKGRYTESLKIYYKILKIYEANNDEYSTANILNSLGEILKKSDRLDEAMVNYNKALNIFIKLDAKADMANCYYNIGTTYAIQKKYDDALKYLNKALELDKQVNSLWGTAYDYESIGEVYFLRENYNDALQVHLKALGIREKLQQKRELSAAHTQVGLDYLMLKDYIRAKENLERALFFAEDVGSNAELQNAYKWLSKLYEETLQHKQALEFHKKFIAVKDSVFNETKSKQLQELQERFNSERKQADILALEKDAEIKDLKLRRQGTLRNILIALAISVIVLSFLLYNRYTFKHRVKIEAIEKKRQIEEAQRKTEYEKQRVLELEKIDTLKDQFLANTSHELRTPLNGIIGLSESLKDGAAGKLSARAIENLDMIANSGKRLSNLVNDILDFSKLKNKDLKLSLQPVDLYSVSKLVIKVSETLVNGKSIKLINAIPKNVVLVEADENRLQQILYNLIGNAIKFTEEGKVEIKTEELNGKVAISITDTGIGIPENKFDDIFKSFEQLDGSNIRAHGGTGLGLSVTKQLVELHGGNIEVHSKVGEGSKFTFTLSVSDKTREDIGIKGTEEIEEQVQIMSSENQEIISSIENNDRKHIKILIVDDEPINRRVLENHLTLANYQVVEANNGKEALELIENDDFDLVLLDIMMPTMSGYEVCEIIRKTKSPSELPIVMLTAKNRVSDLVTGFNLGANDYLTKPFSKNELLSRIKMHLNLNGIHKATSRFVPSEFLKSVGREAITDVVLGDFTEKKVTVMFADVRDYTSLSESMTPKQNFKFVNAYVGRMGPLIQNNGGFVNQYLGDGIMALFPEKACHALQASIAMQKTILVYNKRRVSEGFKPISIGIGLHTGDLVMGIIGDSKRNDTAIIADTVNTASRMEGVTKYYGANIIISEDSLDTIDNKNNYNFRYLGKVRVKGKSKPVGIYECFDGDDRTSVEQKLKTIKTFEKGLKYFFNKEFPKASAAFDKVLTKNPQDYVANYFVTKSAEYTISGTSEDWDKVNIINTK
ncbi:tetratricopeptide repeat protein [Flavisericum labens]|uniref:tetratricopeptide repeat protein n=1 Tax=Flavisericum labens TaxID=3377112 RepID=UPI00387AC3D4